MSLQSTGSSSIIGQASDSTPTPAIGRQPTPGAELPQSTQSTPTVLLTSLHAALPRSPGGRGNPLLSSAGVPRLLLIVGLFALLLPAGVAGQEPQPEPEPEPRQEPVDPEKPWGPERPMLGGALGTARSWSGQVQGTSFRLTLGVSIPWLLVAGEADVNLDNLWRPNKARTYLRGQLRAFGALDLRPLHGFSIWIGAGGGGGIWRMGPGDSRPIRPTGGFFELVQLNIHIDRALMGVRIEQRQTWQPEEALPVDHSTALMFMIGGIVDE
jgi:hypothetical protein